MAASACGGGAGAIRAAGMALTAAQYAAEALQFRGELGAPAGRDALGVREIAGIARRVLAYAGRTVALRPWIWRDGAGRRARAADGGHAAGTAVPTRLCENPMLFAHLRVRKPDPSSHRRNGPKAPPRATECPTARRFTFSSTCVLAGHRLPTVGEAVWS